MDDLEILRNMLERAKIEFAEIEHVHHGGIDINVERGYAGFSTNFSFDINRNLVDMGAYEG